MHTFPQTGKCSSTMVRSVKLWIGSTAWTIFPNAKIMTLMPYSSCHQVSVLWSFPLPGSYVECLWTRGRDNWGGDGTFVLSLSKFIRCFGGQYSVVVRGGLNAGDGDEVVENMVRSRGVSGRNDSREWQNLIGLCIERVLMDGRGCSRGEMSTSTHRYIWPMLWWWIVRCWILFRFWVEGGILVDVRVSRREGGEIADHLVVKERLRVEQKWKWNRRVGGGSAVLKVS